MAMFSSLQYLENQETCNQLVLDLAENMASILGYISDVQQFAKLVQLKTAIEDVQPLLADTTNFIIQYTSQSETGKFRLLVLSGFVTNLVSQRTPLVLYVHRPIEIRLTT
jgi:hypothetical protein